MLDDQSTDGTIELARRFRGIPVEIVRNPVNLGLFGNHRRALEFAAEADFWHLLHADDRIEPDFFSVLLPPLETAPTWSFAYGEHEYIDESGRRIGPSFYPIPRGTGPVTRNQVLREQSELRSIQLHSLVFKTGRVPAPCQFRTDMPQAADVAFHAEWAARSPYIWRTDRVLSQVRMHEGQATRKNSRQLQAWVLDEWRVMQLVAGLIDESKLRRRVRRQKLRFLWAARCRVKMEMVRAENPGFAEEIRAIVHREMGATAWGLGSAAVWVRDTCLPRRFS